jgi:hypothetical protein
MKKIKIHYTAGFGLEESFCGIRYGFEEFDSILLNLDVEPFVVNKFRYPCKECIQTNEYQMWLLENYGDY